MSQQIKCLFFYYYEYSLLLSVLTMDSVESRNVKYTFIKAIKQFYSRIVLTKVNHNQTVLFRKLEKERKLNIKANADIQFLKLYSKCYPNFFIAFKDIAFFNYK